MNARRFISILALGALFMAQAAPASQGHMLCRMKMPARTEACSRCDAPKAGEASPSLRATSCCRTASTPSTEATPLVPASRASAGMDTLPLLVSHAVSAVDASQAIRAGSWLPVLHPPDLERPSRTTVLRN
ncbi:MAG TPA: hypothetical protein VL857_00670 [Candidatus Eisenbacteria bacterium]|nr:hypothetical protein [Candidatus Eisenbacteria bacterium]